MKQRAILAMVAVVLIGGVTLVSAGTAGALTASAPNLSVTNDPGLAGATVFFPAPTVGDINGSATVVCTPGTGFFFPIGTTTVDCMAIDNVTTVPFSFTVTVTDDEAPTITASDDLVVPNEPGLNTALVNYAAPVVADNAPGVTYDCFPGSGLRYALGITGVTCTATDASGNTATDSFTITIKDVDAPVLTVPDPEYVVPTDPGQASASGVQFPVTITDNDPTASFSCSPPQGSTFPLGATTVTCIAIDGLANTSTKTFAVRVVDTEKPKIAVADVTLPAAPGQAFALTAGLPGPTITDNVPGVFGACNVPPMLGIGVHTITCDAVDAAGNTATATYTITVLDKELPVLPALPELVVEAPPGETGTEVTFAPPATDNSGTVTVVCTPPSGSVFPLGVTVVRCVATDPAGNSIDGSFGIHVSSLPVPDTPTQTIPPATTSTTAPGGTTTPGSTIPPTTEPEPGPPVTVPGGTTTTVTTTVTGGGVSGAGGTGSGSGSGGALARTGSEPAPMAAAGLLAVVLGGLVTVLARRRTRTS